jgi:hypothetical protein
MMVKLLDSPGVQLVPPAMGVTTDHCPLAHRWNEFPSMQFHVPSLVQGPLCVPAADVAPEEPDADGVLAGLPVAEPAVSDPGGSGLAMAVEVATVADLGLPAMEVAEGAAVAREEAGVVATVVFKVGVTAGVVVSTASAVGMVRETGPVASREDEEAVVADAVVPPKVLAVGVPAEVAAELAPAEPPPEEVPEPALPPKGRQSVAVMAA